MEKLMNVIILSFVQDTVKVVKRGGNPVEVPVKHSVEFKEETDMAITSEGLSDFLIGKLFQYQNLQRLQGKKDRFDLSLPIELSISVNENQKLTAIKFSTNVKTLASRLKEYPFAVKMVFDPRTLNYGTSRQDILAYAEKSNVLIAPAIKKEALVMGEDLPVAEEVVDENK